jgi:hypothetical protein
VAQWGGGSYYVLPWSSRNVGPVRAAFRRAARALGLDVGTLDPLAAAREGRPSHDGVEAGAERGPGASAQAEDIG